MTKYNDFKGNISVDFEGVHFPIEEKIKELMGINLHKDDKIIGFKLTAGEYHHSKERLPLTLLTLEVINKVDQSKPEDEMKIKEVKQEISMENFLRLFKRLELDLKPYNMSSAD